MSKIIYESVIGGYSFVMVSESSIEVWEDFNSDYPDSYIPVKPGSISNEKQFHYEIADWYMRNVGG